MSEVSNNQNLNSHYTANIKVARPVKTAVTAPEVLPSVNLFDNKKADQRMYKLNDGIYQDYKKEKAKENSSFFKTSAAIGVGIIGILGLRKLFKKS